MSIFPSNMQWYVVPLNPVPWAVGPLTMGRRKSGGQYPVMGRNIQLAEYQKAVRAELTRQRAEMIHLEDGQSYELVFVFHQVTEHYQTASGRATQSKQGDLTNLTKATEDAIQDLLITNDTNVEKSTLYVQRSEGVNAVPYVVIGVAATHSIINPDSFPAEVWEGVDLAVAEHRAMTGIPDEVPTQGPHTNMRSKMPVRDITPIPDLLF